VTFGVLETALGGAAAYFTYKVLRRRRGDQQQGEPEPQGA
jgi:hypothetical protein